MPHPPDGPFPPAWHGPWAERERRLDAFEAVWRAGGRPRIEDHLPAGPDRAAVLLELACLELELRLKAGETATAEEYRDRFPDLAAAPALLAELTAHERAIRRSTAPDTTLPAIPGFAVEAELGRGGMGVVYQARDLRLRRPVALKLLWGAALADAAAVARFRAEGPLAARLDHPNVLKVYEVGEHHGCPFLVLEYVAGGDLARHLRQGLPPPRDAATLVATLARAVQHAHDRGVVHRDLKPANVLGGWAAGSLGGSPSEGDAAPQQPPKIADFGLAKQLEASAGLTASHGVFGTPAYVAPEQARGPAAAVGPPADTYALGAILYECLTGRPPFQGTTPLDILDQVIREEPLPPRRLRPGVPRDLETIALKCLEKAPGKRYASAVALAEDLERWLAGQTIRARPAGWSERAWKWARRRPTLAALILLSVAAGVALAGLALGLWQALGERETALAQAVAERRVSNTYLYAGDVRLAFLQWKQGNVAAVRALLARHVPAPGEPDLRGFEWHYLHRLAHPPLAPWATAGPAHRLALAPDGRTLASAAADGAVQLWDLQAGRATAILAAGAGLEGLAFQADGTLLTFAADQAVRSWDAATGRPRGARDCRQPQAGRWALSADGRWLAAALAPDHRDPRGGVVVWDLVQGRTFYPCPGHRERCQALAFSPDGRWLAVCDFLTYRAVDLAAGREVRRVLLTGPAVVDAPVTAAAVSARGWHLALGHANGWVTVLGHWLGDQAPASTALVCGDVRFPAHLSAVRAMAFGPTASGDLLTGGDGLARRWWVRGATAFPQGTYRGHDGPVLAAAFLADGETVVSAGADRTLRRWTPDLGRDAQPVAVRLRGLTNGGGRGTPVAVSPDGTWVAVAGADRTVRLVDLEAGTIRATLAGHGEDLMDVAVSPDGKLVASADLGQAVRLWDATTGQVLRTWTAAELPQCVGFTPDGRSLVVALQGGPRGTAQVWDVAPGAPRWTLVTATPGRVCRLAFSPDGVLLTADNAGVVRRWDLATGREIGDGRRVVPRENALIAVTPDGRRLLTAGVFEQTDLTVWDFGGNWRGPWPQAAVVKAVNNVTDLGVSHDGTRAVLAAGGTTVLLVDLRRGVEERWFPGDDVREPWHQPWGRRDRAVRVAWVPGRERFVALSSAGVLTVWDPATWAVRRPAGQDVGAVRGLAFTADGRDLLSVSDDRPPAPRQALLNPLPVGAATLGYRKVTPQGQGEGLRRWDAATGAERPGLPGRTVGGLGGLTLAADGRTAFAGDSLGLVWAWDLDRGGPPAGPWFTHAEGRRWWQARQPPAAFYLPFDEAANRPIRSVAVSPDGRRLAAAPAGGPVYLVDRASGAVTATCPAAADPIALAFTADGGQLLAAAGPGVVAWDAATGREVGRWPCHAPAATALAPGGALLATAGQDHRIRLGPWPPDGPPRELVGHTAAVTALAFSPDGRTLASAGQDNTVRLWQVATGQELGILEGDSPLAAVAFRPDSRVLAAGGDHGADGGGAILLWSGAGAGAPP